MPTDDERRDVARRMRHEARTCIHSVLLSPDDALRLADLIEPGEPKVKCVAEVKIEGAKLDEAVHRAMAEYAGVDRDALLALADEIEDVESVMGCVNAANGGWLFVAHRHNDIANRIREACGEADG